MFNKYGSIVVVVTVCVVAVSIVTLIFALKTSQVKPCPEYYFDTPSDQRGLNVMKTFERARTVCHDRGDTLPTPRSAEEFKCFSSFASGYSTWLGFKRDVGENNFRDMEGRAMDYSNFTSTEFGPPPKGPECVVTIGYTMYRMPCKWEKFVACQRN